MSAAFKQQKVSIGTSTFFSAIISIGVLLVLIMAAVYGVPYLYNRSARPMAGNAAKPESLNGTWTGTVQVTAKADYLAYLKSGGQGVPPATSPRAAVLQLTASTAAGWGVPKFSGRVDLCDATGQRYSAHYEGEAILAPSDWQIVLRNPDGSETTSLQAKFIPGRLDVKWEYLPDHLVTGQLSKTTTSNYQELCNRLR